MTKAALVAVSTRVSYLGALLFAAVLLWSSCGDNDSEATPSPTPAPTGTATAPVVHLGIVQSLTGAGEAYGKTVVEGMELAIEQFNETGAAGGIHFEHTVVDDGSTVDGARNAFSQLIADEVDALLGPTLSGTAPEAHRVAQEAAVPTLASTTTGVGITDVGDYIFRIALAEAVVVPSVIAHVAEQAPISQAVLIIDSTDAFSLLSAEAMRSGLAAVGGTVLAEIDLAQTDATEALGALDGQAFEAFLITPLVEQSAQAVSAVRAAGFEQTIIGGNSFNTLDIARLAGPAIEGAFVGAAWNPGLGTDISLAFLNDYTAAYGHAPDQFAAQGYSTVLVLADALARAGETDGAGIRDALAATSDVDTPLGSLSFSERRDAVHAPVIQQYRDGELEVVE